MADYTLHMGDCLEYMATMPDSSVDAVITDPPYGTTACKWDTIIPLDAMWSELKRIAKPKAAIVLFGTQPFASLLVTSNLLGYKYEWIWKKERGVGFQIAKHRPMMQTENILVFSANEGAIVYFPQMEKMSKPKIESFASTKSESSPLAHINNGKRLATHRYPKNIIEARRDMPRLHPTQKPVGLLEYLVRTYTNEGDTVLDFTMGSGTTGVACMNTGRKFIGCELEPKYFEIAKQRIEAATMQPSLLQAAAD